MVEVEGIDAGLRLQSRALEAALDGAAIAAGAGYWQCSLRRKHGPRRPFRWRGPHPRDRTAGPVPAVRRSDEPANGRYPPCRGDTLPRAIASTARRANRAIAAAPG